MTKPWLIIVFISLIYITPTLCFNFGFTTLTNEMFYEETCSTTCSDGLVCLNNTCVQCSTNAQCEAINSETSCKPTLYKGGLQHLCVHKTLFSDFSTRDAIAFSISFIAAAISAGGGIGGGGIFVPVLILIAKFSPKEAIPLSNALVSGASIANFVQNFGKAHPYASTRPLIDYTIALLIEPLTLGGTIFGVYLHDIFPAWLILLLLVIVMVLTTFRTLKKGIATHKMESRATLITFAQPYPTMKTIDAQGNAIEEAPLINDGDRNGEIVETVNYEIPWLKIIALVVILALSTALSVLKGGGDEDPSARSPIGIQKCSAEYWVTAFAIFPVILAVWGYVGRQVIIDSKRRQLLGFPLMGEPVWNTNRVVIIGVVSFVAGILAALLGIGGGIVKGPVLLELGLSADVTAATSSYMILFTSTSASIQYILLKKLSWDYGVVLFVLGVIASFIGQTVLNILVRRYNKKSYIIFVIAFVIGVSAILLIITEAFTIFKSGASNKFTWIC